MTEFMPENDVIVTNNVKEPSKDAKPPFKPDKKKKKSGAFSFFKAALYQLRKRSGAKKTDEKQKSNGSNAGWKKLVGSMRPLSVPEDVQSPPHRMSAVAAAAAFEEIIPPASPAISSASSSYHTMSSYNSAASLRDLYNCSDNEDDDEEDPDEVFDALTGDEMIDSKAEEFIAQFYKQIQFQNSNRRHQSR